MDDYQTRLNDYVLQCFTSDVKQHVITELHRHDLYGHWRCSQPGTSVSYFDIITWPGGLCYSGDMGTYVFKRSKNMIGWISSACRSTSYVSEKCVAADCIDGITEFRREVFEERLQELLDAADDQNVSAAIVAIRELLSDDSSPDDYYKIMSESCLWDEIPSCSAYTFRFLWCLRAIEWFCQRVENDS